MERNQTRFSDDVTVENNIQEVVINSKWLKKKHNSFYRGKHCTYSLVWC